MGKNELNIDPDTFNRESETTEAANLEQKRARFLELKQKLFPDGKVNVQAKREEIANNIKRAKEGLAKLVVGEEGNINAVNNEELINKIVDLVALQRDRAKLIDNLLLLKESPESFANRKAIQQNKILQKQLNNIVVLDCDTLGNSSLFDSFQTFGTVRIFATTSSEQRLEHISNASIVITNKVVINKEIIDACPQLRLICVTATGTNNIDSAYAQQKGIVVKNVAGYSTESVVQHTFAVLLSLLQHTEYYSHYVASKAYSQQNLFTHIGKGFIELNGRTWGIIGLGTIGKRVAEVASVFGCKVVYYSTSGKNYNPNYPRLSLQELLKTADVISIHAPLNEQTNQLIGLQELQLMKKTAYIVNVGRGGIIQENALAQALTQNLIAGACLDVMQTEPLPIESPLLAPEIQHKLLITPHVAWISDKAMKTLLERTYQNVETFIQSQA